MHKGIKFRIYPNKEQQQLINKTFGCCRLIYNKGLDMRIRASKNNEPIGYNQTAAMITSLKGDEAFAFLKEVDIMALQHSLRDLDTAYRNFFAKRAGFPNYKSKHNYYQAYKTNNRNNNIRIAGSYIKLPKLGYVKVKQTLPVEDIRHAIIERTATGKYYVVLNIKFTCDPRPNEGKSIELYTEKGSLYTDSKGRTVSIPEYIGLTARKIERRKKRLSGKKKGSSNYKKQYMKILSAQEKITNQRNDFLQKASTALIRENQTVNVKDLDTKAIAQKNRSGHSLLPKFQRMLEYKAAWYGNELIKSP